MALKVSPLISDHMVLQRDKPWGLSGTAAPEASISVVFNGVEHKTHADDDGAWQVEVGTFQASNEPRVLKVTSTSNKDTAHLTIHDIVIGDVWLLAGQSNMQLWLSRTAHNYPDVMDKSDQLLRIVDIPQIAKLDGPRTPISMDNTSWKPFDPQSAPDFSAVGYFFAAKLRQRYNVPIGLVATAVGGTPIATWLSRAELDKLGIDCTESDRLANSELAAGIAEAEAKAVEQYDSALDKADKGLSENWMAPEFDDSNWETAELTDFSEGSGAHWYRKTLPVPHEMAGRPAQIFLGTAIDKDTVYVNGKEIGTTYYRYPPRNYSFIMPANNITIAIRLLTFSGGGEFTPGKNRFIATDNGTVSLDGPWKRKTGVIVHNAPATTNINNLPSALYNGIIAPLNGTQIKGVAWYQGESDTGNPSDYGKRIAALIESWRALFQDEKLPFVIQQLAYWDHTGPGGSDSAHHENWEALRNQQELALSLPNVGLSAGYDVGEWNDLHPQGKQIVGERLARLAYRVAYHELLPPNMFEQYNLAKSA